MRANELVRWLVAIGAASIIASPAVAGDAAAGKVRANQCFVCHGADGLSKQPDAPNLAGQNETYVIKALKDYRSGKREHEVMSMMAKNLTDDDITNVAAYFSGIVINVKAP
jgi:cytochrome c553